MYTIEVNYTTGDSFTSGEVTDDIGLVWEDKKLAQKALKSLKQHYIAYCDIESAYTKDDTNKAIQSFVKYDWCTNKSCRSSSFTLYQCSVQMDDGKLRELPTGMYCGYFDKLHYAKVVTVDNEEDEDTVYFS